ncbi:MAG: outer membrane lipoprotein carrier protein LolA [Treponema sp.]|nr:outer membrane lipoprotein carrier protein LolA [Treponema sp.]
MKKLLAARCSLLTIALFFFLSSPSFSQGILTASSFFKSVSENYATIKDYEADVDIKAGKTNMSGKVSYKLPNLLRIDFTNPEDQVICFNGDLLTIYLPGSAAILNQTVDNSNNNGANLATAQGLSLLSRYYSPAYETGQDAVPLDEGSEEMVVNLILRRRNMSEAFSSIKMSVLQSTMLIRRIEATTPQGETFTFDFKNYKLNQGISDQRFIYDPPTSANNYNNFLFSE